ncbi:MAG: hypothetical protein ACRDPG_14655, partial [Nocardioidaceae bacterium]
MEKKAAALPGPLQEKFAPPAGRYLGLMVVAIAAITIVVVLVQDDFARARGLLLLALAFGLTSWVILVRPRVAAHKSGLVMTNMLRDVFVPWGLLGNVRLSQTLQVATKDGRVVHGLGLTKSARRSVKSSLRKDRDKTSPGGVFGFHLGGPMSMRSDPMGEAPKLLTAREEQQGGEYLQYAEQRIHNLAHAARADTEMPLRKSWALLPCAALGLAVLCVVLV